MPQRHDVPRLARAGEVLQAPVAHVDADRLARVAGERRGRLYALCREARLARLEDERAARGARVEQAPGGHVPAHEVQAGRRVAPALGDGHLRGVVAREVPVLVAAALVEVLRRLGVGQVRPEAEAARAAARERQRRERDVGCGGRAAQQAGGVHRRRRA
ncbi:MAG: hypothetical protein AVDCRST_MAG13-275 [uncultured Solirubrobacteraceae bacterium]|uniref:Uncharacterized protein n=1 Tax=uncultured Solirubrobacteraceae bacterium TaxID=1162706 RepID=A0A6J4RH45_9ACTN|nr:MAG: hypothetical protein AVDCRST_MAG13-275 [uncultured Solirubrobacteraceae bacterium]